MCMSKFAIFIFLLMLLLSSCFRSRGEQSLSGARERSIVTTTVLSDGDVTSQRTAAGVSDGRQWTFCFVRFILHFRTFPDLSTPPSRPSAGIRQRWNGCLKRTTLSVTGFRVLRNETFLSCHASSFLFVPLRFFVSVRITEESQTCVSVFAPWR